MESVWEKVKAGIKKQILLHSYQMWIEPLSFKNSNEGAMVLTSPNYFSRKRVLNQYSDVITSELFSITGKQHKLDIQIASGKERSLSECNPDNDRQIPLPTPGPHSHCGRMLRKDFTFDQFVVGNNNDFAYSASLSLASLRNSMQNSLFLMSKTGMGKSHLSQAIGHHIMAIRPMDHVYYITAEDFTNEMVHSFQHDTFNKFKNKYRNGCDVLLMDDVQYLSGKERTQVELASTLDSMFEANKRIIFSSCCPPGDIPRINDKLRSRLSSGLISNIEPPNFRTRVRILQKKAAHNGYETPLEVLEYLASELTEDVRQLESGLIGVSAKASLMGGTVDLPLAESVVRNIVRIRKAITVEAIKKMVCRQYRVSVQDVVSPSRKRCYVRPRQIAIYLARRFTDSPLQAIGKSFNRYHATALHSINSIERGIKQNRSTRKQVEYLCEKLESGEF
jgi:chromosomal replication initiator protein